MVQQPPGPAHHTHLTCASPPGMMAAELQADSMSRHSGQEPGSGQMGALPVHSSGGTPKMGRPHSVRHPQFSQRPVRKRVVTSMGTATADTRSQHRRAADCTHWGQEGPTLPVLCAHHPSEAPSGGLGSGAAAVRYTWHHRECSRHRHHLITQLLMWKGQLGEKPRAQHSLQLGNHGKQNPQNGW